MSDLTDAGVAMEIEQFAASRRQRPSGAAWQLESPRCLEVNLNNESVAIKVGAMIAYRGDLKFERASTGGLGKMMKAAFTSESGKATIVSGTGVLYLGDKSKEVTVLKLTDDVLYVNSADLLAYSSDVQWDIVTIKGASIVAGGLFTFKLWGNGFVALTTHGDPLVLQVTPDAPLFSDPDATVAWSEGLEVGVKTDVGFKTFTGRASGETYQMHYEGTGFVVLQPFEETAGTSGGRG